MPVIRREGQQPGNESEKVRVALKLQLPVQAEASHDLRPRAAPQQGHDRHPERAREDRQSGTVRCMVVVGHIGIASAQQRLEPAIVVTGIAQDPKGCPAIRSQGLPQRQPGTRCGRNAPQVGRCSARMPGLDDATRVSRRPPNRPHRGQWAQRRPAAVIQRNGLEEDHHRRGEALCIVETHPRQGPPCPCNRRLGPADGLPRLLDPPWDQGTPQSGFILGREAEDSDEAIPLPREGHEPL